MDGGRPVSYSSVWEEMSEPIPGFHVLESTILDFRRRAQPEIAFLAVSALAMSDQPRFTQGPCGAFLARLHELGWKWEHDGFVIDHFGCQLHIQDCPIQLLLNRIQHAWTQLIGFCGSQRKRFSGLRQVDWAISHKAHADFSGEESTQNGTFFTRDTQKHMGFAPTVQCPFCKWECPFFQDIRDQVPAELRPTISSLPECFRYRGWATTPPALAPFIRSLDLIPDRLFDFQCDQLPEGDMYLFSNGACQDPIQPCGRWNVRPHIPRRRARTIANSSSGRVMWGHFSHCICRASSQAILPWVDNQLLHDRLQQWLLELPQVLGHMTKDHDLWNLLLVQVSKVRTRGLIRNIVKVRSHQAEEAYPCHVEKWAIEGNARVDRAAEDAWSDLPYPVRRWWRTLREEVAMTFRLATCIQKVIVQVGSRAVHHSKEVRRQIDKAWDRHVDQPRDMPLNMKLLLLFPVSMPCQTGILWARLQGFCMIGFMHSLRHQVQSFTGSPMPIFPSISKFVRVGSVYSLTNAPTNGNFCRTGPMSFVFLKLPTG